MTSKTKRIFWACNHATLMDVECKLLLDLGFEVFVPKTLGSSRSSSINFSYDNSLSLASDDLNILNSFDFYNCTIPENIAAIINENFDAVISVNIYPMLYNLAKIFKGIFILRGFGYEDKINYEQTTQQMKKIRGVQKIFKPKEITHDNKMMRLLYSMKDRFYLGAGFQEIISNETPFFKKRSIYLPLGIPKSIWDLQDTWIGDTSKIMFVCPSIENAYYGKIYVDFNNNFSDFPHSIFGKQNKDYPEDKNIIGFLDNENYYACMKKYQVMFYHSQEERHLHYHPLEAVIVGMPLIYMSGGLLERFGGQNQPGMARSVAEAKDKLQRILEDDADFINEIKSCQIKLLDEFRDSYIKSQWQKNFMPIFKE